MQKYFKTVSATDSNILSWKSKGLSDQSIKPPTITNKLLNPSFLIPTLENCLFGAVKLTKMLMLININILDIVLDLTEKNFFRSVMKFVEM